MVPTTLILGAGASIPYGFPSTEQLRLNIIQEAGLTNLQELEAYDISKSDVQEFQQAFKTSVAYTDQFLETCNKYLKIGKILLAKALAKYENRKKIFETEIENDWYRFLLDSIVTPDSNFKLTPITILTFNYDRSIEYYLYRVLKDRFSFSEEECKRQLAQIKIYHLYGSLGLLPWQVNDSSDSDKVIEYGIANSTYMNILKAAKSLRIIYERELENNIWERLPDLYSYHERIFFLGFGYNQINLERLQLQHFDKRKFCGGTAKNIGEVEKRKIHDISKDRLQPSNLKDAYIIELFKNHFQL